MKKKLLLIFLFLIIPKQVQGVTNWNEFINHLTNDTEIIELENDIIGDSDVNITKDKTLNLNGYKIISTRNISIEGAEVNIINGKITSTANNTLNIINGGSVNLNNSTIENTNSGGYSIYIKGYADDNGIKTKLLIDKNSIISANFALGIQRNGYASYGVIVDIYGSVIGENTINSYNYGAVGIHILNNIKPIEGNIPEINVYEGANIIAKEGHTGDINADDAPAIYAEGYARWNIKGGIIKGSEAITAFAGEYNISGGELIGIGDFHESQIEANKSLATGSAIALAENSSFSGNIIMNITSGNITSEKAIAIRSLISNTTQTNSIGNINLTGGKYTGEISAVKIPDYEKFISGGCYSSKPSENYLKSEDLSIIKDNDYYCVGIKNKISISEESEKFININTKEAIAGQKVKIVTIKNDEYIISNINVKTISGKEIEVIDGTFEMPNEQVIIEVVYTKNINNPQTSDNVYKSIISVVVSLIIMCVCLVFGINKTIKS